MEIYFWIGLFVRVSIAQFADFQGQRGSPSTSNPPHPTLQLCSTAALQVRRGEDLLTADSPGIKYHPTLKFWPGRDTNFDKLINYPTGDLWTGKLVDGMMEVTAVAAAV